MDRVREQTKRPQHQHEVPVARRISQLETATVVAAVAEYYGVSPESFPIHRNAAASRDVAAWLAARLTTTTLRELAPIFGLHHPGSVSNLLRRAEASVGNSKSLRKDIKTIRERLLKKKNKV